MLRHHAALTYRARATGVTFADDAAAAAISLSTRFAAADCYAMILCHTAVLLMLLRHAFAHACYICQALYATPFADARLRYHDTLAGYARHYVSLLFRQRAMPYR